MKRSLDRCQAELLRHSLSRFATEKIVLEVFLSESLNGAYGGERLVQHLHGGAVEFLHLVVTGADLAAGVLCQEKEYRRDGKRDRSELPVNASGDEQHRDECEGCSDHRDDSLDEDILHGWSVVLDAVGGVVRSATIVKCKGEALRVPEELSPKVVNDTLTRVGLEE